MNDDCLRKSLENFPAFQMLDIRTKLGLLCCNVCKKINNNEPLNKYEKLYVFPLLLSYRNEEHLLIRTLGSVILEDVADEFGNADTKQIEEFFSLMKGVVEGKTRYSSSDLLKLSEGSYCKVAARIYWGENYLLLRYMALEYIVNNTIIVGSHVRNNWYHKMEDEPFFVIGVGLDEGITESITIDMLTDRESGQQEIFNDAYFFERKFVDKIIDTFGFERKEFLAGSFYKTDFIEFLNEASKRFDYCDFYDILSLSDKQKWKEVFSILKKYENY